MQSEKYRWMLWSVRARSDDWTSTVYFRAPSESDGVREAAAFFVDHLMTWHPPKRRRCKEKSWNPALKRRQLWKVGDCTALSLTCSLHPADHLCRMLAPLENSSWRAKNAFQTSSTLRSLTHVRPVKRHRTPPHSAAPGETPQMFIQKPRQRRSGASGFCLPRMLRDREGGKEGGAHRWQTRVFFPAKNGDGHLRQNAASTANELTKHQRGRQRGLRAVTRFSKLEDPIISKAPVEVHDLVGWMWVWQHHKCKAQSWSHAIPL